MAAGKSKVDGFCRDSTRYHSSSSRRTRWPCRFLLWDTLLYHVHRYLDSFAVPIPPSLIIDTGASFHLMGIAERAVSYFSSAPSFIKRFHGIKLLFDQWRGEKFLAWSAVDNWVAHFAAWFRSGSHVRKIERLILQRGWCSLNFVKRHHREKMEPGGIYFDKSSFHGVHLFFKGEWGGRDWFGSSREERLMMWLWRLWGFSSFWY